MAKRVVFFPLVLLLGIILLGCDSPTPVATNPTGPPGPPTAPPSPAETKVGVFAGGIDDLAARPSEPAQQPAAPPAEESATERVKAEKGVGIKGRSLDQYSGILVEPAKQYFRLQERILFEDRIPHALNLYKASEGQSPKSHEEFMEKIIQFNQIKLPQLPPEYKYVYDVQAEQLMVERPKKQ